jgi:hypothetical protein
VRIFPNGESCLRLVRALAVETHENWLETRKPKGKFAPDSWLEQAGFELTVPRIAGERCRKHKLPSRAMAMVGARRGSKSAPFMVGP